MPKGLKISRPPIVNMALHFNLPDIMHVPTKMHGILRRNAVLTWMHDNKENSVACNIME
jgi:hypothetical protein